MGFWEKSKDVVMRKLLFRFFKFCVSLRVYCKIEMLMCDTVEEKVTFAGFLRIKEKMEESFILRKRLENS